MYCFAYDALFDDKPQNCGAVRRPRIEDAIELLEAAATAGAQSHQVLEALSFMHRIWPCIIEEMCLPENDLPQSSRAGLISIGRFILDEVEQVWFGKPANLKSLIAITNALSQKLG